MIDQDDESIDQMKAEQAHAEYVSDCKTDETIKACKDAIHHVLNAIADDPRKFWLMGDMTGSYEKLIEAAAAIWNMPADKLKADFRPRKDEWERYLARREDEERLLRYCEDNGITGKRE